MPEDPTARRPLRSRSTGWARGLSSWLARTGCTPNGISLASIAVALLGAAAVIAGSRAILPHWLGWIALAAMIQLRLLCNLMDGMVAVEGGKKSPTGDLWNEVPDRIADMALFLAAGYASHAVEAGWTAGVLAVGTAYVRQTGAALLGKHDFCGPMAKPHRMASLTLTAIVAVWRVDFVPWALWIIAAGTFLTAARRLRRIAKELASRRP